MFTSSKFAAVCLAVTALFNDVNAEAEVAQTFGLLGSGYRASSNAGPYGAPSGGVHGGAGASARPARRSAGHGGLGIGIHGRGAGVGNAYGSTSFGGVIGIGGPASGFVNNNAYGGVGGVVRPGVGATNGAGRPVSGTPSGTAGAGAVVNTGPYGSIGEITRPGVGKPANGGTSGNAAGVTDDKRDNNAGGGVSGATDTGAAGTKGAEKPVTDAKDMPTVVVGDKKVVPVVAAGGAAVPETGKPANGGTSGNAAGVTDDKKNNNAGGGVSGATDTGAAGTKGAEKSVIDGKDRTIVVGADGKPCTNGVGGATGTAVKSTPMLNGNMNTPKPLKSGAKMSSKFTTTSPYNGRAGAVTQRVYRKLRSS